jgi:hypothetical protein
MTWFGPVRAMGFRIRAKTVTGALTMTLMLSPGLLAQTAAPSASASKPTGLMHDVAGVWNAAAAPPRPAGAPAPPPPQVFPAGSMVPNGVTMTPWAQTRFEAAKGGIGGTADPYRNCEPLGPTRWTQYVHPFEILQTPDRIFFFYEIDHLWRIVYMDGRPIPKVDDLPFGPSYMGYSVGHWEGDDLIVDTIGVTEKTWIDTAGDPHSDNMHLTERYHRVNHDSLELSFSFDDPKAYSKSWTYGPKRYALKSGPQWEIQESECILSDEKRFEQNVSDSLNQQK